MAKVVNLVCSDKRVRLGTADDQDPPVRMDEKEIAEMKATKERRANQDQW